MTTTVERPQAPARRAATPKQPSADPRQMPGRQDWQTWPQYEAAVLGFRNYWYPLTWSKHVSKSPTELMLLGEQLSLVRDGSGIRATRVGVEVPAGDRDERQLEYATYPAAERLGIVWIYVGDVATGEKPPPVESDIPSELVADDAVVVGRMTRRHGNWRFGAENGFDEGHAKYLHRRSLWTLRRQMPTWVRHHIEPTGEGWITRVPDEVHYDTEFPGLGWWPPKRFFRSIGRGKATVSIRLPCFLRVAYAPWQHYEWWVPIDEDHHVYLQLVSKRARKAERVRFWLYYRFWVRWVFHGLFNDEDALMVDVMDAPPERLYRPDVAITEWRKLCEAQTRGVPQTTTPEVDALRGLSDRPETPDIRSAGMPITHRIRELIRQ
jgi:phenylpropionate dioxygenase-like ring-hydroxylating dioxygenase large terminal subunit